ncbi:hypothetical protein [Actinospica sp.]|uniref:hypothetical protein n=1 Tax=Actinospica sp. TaxID=1872142 RepID=UPI002D1B834B|nr:hypothetical protein [Actinospica sp.]HWG26182.1 hypothetical protein [Actinospica sp.]
MFAEVVVVVADALALFDALALALAVPVSSLKLADVAVGLPLVTDAVVVTSAEAEG